MKNVVLSMAVSSKATNSHQVMPVGSRFQLDYCHTALWL